MRLRSSLLGLSLLLFASLAFSQTTGSVSGIARDSNGAPLPGVLVAISGPQMPLGRTTTTLSDGAFQFFNLVPGTYQLRAELAGLGAFTPGGRRRARQGHRGQARAAGDGRRGGDRHRGHSPRRHQVLGRLRRHPAGDDREAASGPHLLRDLPARARRHRLAACRSPTRTSASTRAAAARTTRTCTTASTSRTRSSATSTRTSPSWTSRRSTSRAAACSRSTAARAASSSTASRSPARTTCTAR